MTEIDGGCRKLERWRPLVPDEPTAETTDPEEPPRPDTKIKISPDAVDQPRRTPEWPH